jgi:hypothetical protein
MTAPEQHPRHTFSKEVTVTREYAPNAARQVQALLRLLEGRSGASAAGQPNEDVERLNDILPECTADENN